MLVHLPTKSLVLRLRDPGRVLEHIPGHSRLIHHDGQPLVQVKHGVDEVRILRNLGFDAPGPILYHFGWPKVRGKFDLRDHQRITADFIVQHPRCVVLNEMSTGKTASFIAACEYLLQTKQVKRALIVAPLSTLQRTWHDEVFRCTMHRKVGVVYGPKAKRLKVLSEIDQYDYLVINHDGIEVVYKELEALVAAGEIDMIGYDEADALRNARTERYRLFSKLVIPLPRLVLMTATPTPSEPTDAWAPARLVNPKNVPAYYSKFRDMVMRQVTPYKWVPTLDAEEIVFQALQPAIRFRTRDCIDMPPEVYVDVECQLSKPQQEAWDELKRDSLALVGDQTVTAANAAVRVAKLLQVALGVVYDQQGVPAVVGCPSRVAETLELIRKSPGKVIVFVPFTGALGYFAEQIGKHYTVEVVDGSVSAGKRDRIFGEFQNLDDPRVLVANPEAMSHGLNLARASTVVWAAPIFKAGVYAQANGRIKRTDQENHMTIAHLGASALEWSAYKVLQDRLDTQESILDLYKEFLKGGK